MSSPRDNLSHTKPASCTHLGVWLDRYVGKKLDQDTNRQFLLDALGVIKVPEGYAAALERRQSSLQKTAAQTSSGVVRPFRITVSGRVACGLGNASPLENGLSLLHTWGMPYLPGSSLKGVAAGFATQHGGDGWRGPKKPGGDAEDYHRGVFGDVTCKGFVVFHDAWWEPSRDAKLPVALDVMTPHHKDYYTGQGEAPPADWDSPTPVSFLTAHGSFVGALAGPRAWVDLAGQLLEQALSEHGIGAKTAAGYGRGKLEWLRSEEELAELERERAHHTLGAALKAEVLSLAPGNAGPFFGRLCDGERQGLSEATLREFAQAAVQRLSKAWCREWLAKRSSEEAARVLLERLMPELAAHTAAPPPEAVAAGGEEVLAFARKPANKKDHGKKLVVHYRQGDGWQQSTVAVNKVEEATKQPLLNASETKPLAVRARVEDGKLKEICGLASST